MVCHVPGSHQKVNGVSVLNLPGDTALDALKKQCAPAKGNGYNAATGFRQSSAELIHRSETIRNLRSHVRRLNEIHHFQRHATAERRRQRSPRLRAHRNFHPELTDPVQRLAIAMEPGTYIRPHRHPHTFELLLALSGRFVVLTLMISVTSLAASY